MISVILTVLNEGENVHRLMRSMAAQTRPPDEVVIVDGGSHDNTAAVIQSYADQLPLRVLVEPGCNISAGRNRAIAAAAGDIIAATDAGVTLAPDWLEKLTRPFIADSTIQMVGGFFRAEATTPFEVVMGATVLPLVDEVNPQTFLPSSRSVAFRKNAWERVDGYPEWLDYCEDLIFDLRLKRWAEREIAAETPNRVFMFAPDAVVDFRPRGTMIAFFKQYFRYARGDGKADLWRRRHMIRYLTYLVAFPGILLVGLVIHPLFWLLYLLGAFYYCYPPYRRLRTMLQRPEIRALFPIRWTFLITLAHIPIIRLVGDLAKMIGYPVGWWWRWRNMPPNWRSL